MNAWLSCCETADFQAFLFVLVRVRSRWFTPVGGKLGAEICSQSMLHDSPQGWRAFFISPNLSGILNDVNKKNPPMRIVRHEQSGLGAIEVLLIVLVIAALVVIGWAQYQQHQSKSTSVARPVGASTHTDATGSQPGKLVSYTSSQEKATFTYPNTWKATEPVTHSNDHSNPDLLGLVSPSGAITISWVSQLSGFGDEHGASYPLISVIDTTPIGGAPGLYVVSGITTLDGMSYHPWIAVQDSTGMLTSGVQGDVAVFGAKHPRGPSGNLTDILFATCGLHTTDHSPRLTKDQALAWLSSMESQQARQILLSLSDPA